MLKFKLKSIAALITILFLGASVYANKQALYKKEYHEVYQVQNDVQVNISNKYGLVKIITGPYSAVTIDVSVSLEARNSEKASEQLQKIAIEFSGTGLEVNAKTIIEKSGKFHELDIDYSVQMPIGGKLNVSNSFGDLYLNELNGSATIFVAYGKAEIGKLNHKQNNVKVKFGELKLDYAAYVNVVSRYSKVRVDKAKLLNIDTQYSEVEAKQIGRVVLSSAYDEVVLGTVVELDAKLRFGELDVSGLLKEFKLDAQYTDVDVDFIAHDFDSIDVASSFGDVVLSFETGSNFKFDGKASYGDINIPSGTVSTVQNASGSDSYEGAFFSGKPIGEVKARLSYGDLKISIH